jgi:cysteine synthase
VTILGSKNVLEAIGSTPLVELQRVVPPRAARVVAKLESANPTGSNPSWSIRWS